MQTNRNRYFFGYINLRVMIEAQKRPGPDPIQAKGKIPRNTPPSVCVVKSFDKLGASLIILGVGELDSGCKHIPQCVDMIRLTILLETEVPGILVVQDRNAFKAIWN